MMSPQEGRYTKIAAVAAVIALVIAFLAWIHPFAPPSNVSPVEPGKTLPPSSESPASPSPELKPSDPPVLQPLDSREPSTAGVSGTGLTSGIEDVARPHIKGVNPVEPTRSCGAPEIATLRPGAPAKVASGLAVLSVKAAREGSEPYITLGIASDRDTLTEAVLGASGHYRFATSRGAYFVNVTDVDLAAGTMTVQVGCEAKENTL